MKYTDEQKRILALCRKYNGVKVQFFNTTAKQFHIIIDSNFHLLDNMGIGYIEDWLKTHATSKQVGRPKGSTKPSRKVRKFVSLSADQWSAVEKIRNQQGLKYASHAIGLAVESFCANHEKMWQSETERDREENQIEI